MTDGVVITSIVPFLYLFLAIIFMMVMGSYIMHRENVIMYIIFVLTLVYYGAEYFYAFYAPLTGAYMRLTIANSIMCIVLPFETMLYFILIARPRRWHKYLWILPIFNALIYVYSIFAQNNPDLPNLGIIFGNNNSPIYGVLWPSVFASGSIISLLLIIDLIKSTIRKETHWTRLLVVLYISIANCVAIVLGTIHLDISIIGIVSFISLLIYYIYLYVYYDNEHQEEMLKKSEIDIMVSQIHPHFLYNTLNSIYNLCGKDDELCKQTIDEFSTYLRLNLRSLTNSELIPIEEEIKHTETYLKIEKLRFEDRLNYEFDIQYSDFKVPALLIQPMVENAVKHGICGREEGGTVWIKIYKEEKHIIIKIIDDGIGFDMKSVDFTKGDHVGYRNTKTRIESMLGGRMEIESEIGKGTEVTITL